MTKKQTEVANKKALWIKILIPVLIVAAIFAIWIVKFNSEKAATEESNAELQEMMDKTEKALPDHLKGADFSLNLTAVVDFEELAQYGIPVIIDYGADSCIPCKEMAPVLKKLNKEMYGKAFIKFADVWEAPDTASNVPVQVIPTQIFVNADGTPFVPSEELALEIEFLMYVDHESDEHIFTSHQGGLTEEQMFTILEEMGIES